MAKKRSAKKPIIITVIIVIVLGAIIGGVLSQRGNDVVPVTVAKVEKRTITQTVSAIGIIQPETEIKISSETSGEIIFIGVQEGDTVHKGELLVRIKPDIVQTQLEQFKAAADAAKMDIAVRKAEKNRLELELKRTTELYEKEFSSKRELETAQASYEQAQSAYQASLARYEQALASFQQIERRMERTVIKAPISGIVTRLTVEEGEKVVGTEMMQGTEIMRVSDLNVMNAVVKVDENDIVLVSIGDSTNIEIDAFPERIFKGKVFEIGHSAIVNQLGTQDQVTEFQVKIRLVDTDPKLRPGMSCNVEIETETKENTLSVPLMAVTVRSENFEKSPDVREGEGGVRKKKDEEEKEVKRPPSVVFLKKADSVDMVKVETGISDDGFIEITKGLEEGQTIVKGSFRAVSKLLKQGSKVRIDTTEAFTFEKD